MKAKTKPFSLSAAIRTRKTLRFAVRHFGPLAFVDKMRLAKAEKLTRSTFSLS